MDIITALSKIPEAESRFGMEEKIDFAYVMNDLSDEAEEVQEAYRGLQVHASRNSPSFSTSSSTETGPTSLHSVPRYYLNQRYVYGRVGENRRPLLLIEYKSPYSFPTIVLRAGFRYMNLKR